MLNNIQDTNNAVEQKDTLGGGNSLFDTDVYKAVIKMAYLGESASGAVSVTYHFDIKGQEFRKTLYVTNKQKKTFYEKDGKEYRLPGFIVADNISLLTTNTGLLSSTQEDRIIKKWDAAASAEVNTKVPVLVDQLNKEVELAIVKQLVNKSVKTDNGYEPTNETKEENDIATVFFAEDGRTVVEIQAKAESASFKEAWIKKNQGQVINKVKEVKGAPRPSSAGNASAAPKKSLFE